MTSTCGCKQITTLCMIHRTPRTPVAAAAVRPAPDGVAFPRKSRIRGRPSRPDVRHALNVTLCSITLDSRHGRTRHVWKQEATGAQSLGERDDERSLVAGASDGRRRASSARQNSRIQRVDRPHSPAPLGGEGIRGARRRGPDVRLSAESRAKGRCHASGPRHHRRFRGFRRIAPCGNGRRRSDHADQAPRVGRQNRGSRTRSAPPQKRRNVK